MDRLNHNHKQSEFKRNINGKILMRFKLWDLLSNKQCFFVIKVEKITFSFFLPRNFSCEILRSYSFKNCNGGTTQLLLKVA